MFRIIYNKLILYIVRFRLCIMGTKIRLCIIKNFSILYINLQLYMIRIGFYIIRLQLFEMGTNQIMYNRDFFHIMHNQMSDYLLIAWGLLTESSKRIWLESCFCFCEVGNSARTYIRTLYPGALQ